MAAAVARRHAGGWMIIDATGYFATVAEAVLTEDLGCDGSWGIGWHDRSVPRLRGRR
jgi:hypothetical protein